ncbi:MAG: FAD-dependent oxidoreductase, partial [Anaerolineales bacterium]
MNNSPESSVDILIVGAGVAGLLAAADLQANGFRPLVVDKGRGVGGRLATRRIGTAAFDHGAQFITARTPRFAALLDSWRAQGVLAEWYRGAEDAHIRWRGAPGMTAPAKHLAQSLNVRLEMKLLALHPEQTGWRAVFENGETLTARAALLTAPVPQSLAVLDAGGVRLEAATRAQLEAIDYEPCIAVMAALHAPSRLPSPGFLRLESEPIAWLADNQTKGVSAVPSI